MSAFYLIILTGWAIAGPAGIVPLASAGSGRSAGGKTSPPYDSPLPTHGKCQAITVPMCQEIQYNQTIMPNRLGHQNQEDAGLEVHQFFPLVKVKCSSYLKFFLCTIYVPVCTVLDEALPPCRSLCVESQRGCLDLMKRFGFQWPENLECSKFPVSGLCVGENQTDPEHEESSYNSEAPESIAGDSHTAREFECPRQFKVNPTNNYRLYFGEKVVADCGMPCNATDNYLFGPQRRKFSRYTVGVVSVVCLLSTLLTVLTFLIDMKRFRYPERPIIFLSGCYCFISITYLVGFAIGDFAACSSVGLVDDNADIDFVVRKMVTQGAKSEACTILFIILYYFTMASAIWWVLLALTWFLSAALKWGYEAIEFKSHFFHLVAWAVPAIMTIAIVAWGEIDGDPISGVCFTGLANVNALRWFVLAPMTLCLVLGLCFLISGFIALFRIRNVIRHDGTQTTKLEKLMVRIGIFGVLYAVPTAVVIASSVYEHVYRADWMRSWHNDICQNPEFAIPCPAKQPQFAKPNFAVFVVRYLMTLVVGITSGFWIWTGKTASSWSNFCHRVCGGQHLSEPPKMKT